MFMFGTNTNIDVDNNVRNIGIPTNTDSIRIDPINTNPRIDAG